MTTYDNNSTLEVLGKRLERLRLQRNWTQAELAREAGIGKRTLERMEDGASVQMTSFLRVLRALELLEALEQAIPETGPSPMERIGGAPKPRSQRARKPKQTVDETKPRTGWRWGDEA